MKTTILRYQKDGTINNGDKELTKHSTFSNYKQMVTSINFNKQGTQLIALRKDLRPCLYLLNEAKPFFYFDHEDFKNVCTLKTCCFAGDDDELFISGSDDFSIYAWKIPKINDSILTKKETLSK